MMLDLHGSPKSPLIMGILNLTPDSFSDGGRYIIPDVAVKHAIEMIDAGADMIDIGGESTRPGSDPVSVTEELSRIGSVLRDLMPSIDVPVSIDTMKPEVAEMALDHGVSMVNDINGLRDERMLDLVVDRDVPAIMMHMHGTPKTLATDVMQGDVIDRIKAFLDERVDAVLDAGMKEKNILLDPGIGFGTKPEQDMSIVNNCGLFSEKYPVVIGPSRKRFLATYYPDLDKDEATAIVSKIAADNGAAILRVHNVAAVYHSLHHFNGL